MNHSSTIKTKLVRLNRPNIRHRYSLPIQTTSRVVRLARHKSVFPTSLSNEYSITDDVRSLSSPRISFLSNDTESRTMPRTISVKHLTGSKFHGDILDNQFRKNLNVSFVYDQTQPEIFDDFRHSTTPDTVPTKITRHSIPGVIRIQSIERPAPVYDYDPVESLVYPKTSAQTSFYSKPTIKIIRSPPETSSDRRIIRRKVIFNDDKKETDRKQRRYACFGECCPCCSLCCCLILTLLLILLFLAGFVTLLALLLTNKLTTTTSPALTIPTDTTIKNNTTMMTTVASSNSTTIATSSISSSITSMSSMSVTTNTPPFTYITSVSASTSNTTANTASASSTSISSTSASSTSIGSTSTSSTSISNTSTSSTSISSTSASSTSIGSTSTSSTSVTTKTTTTTAATVTITSNTCTSGWKGVTILYHCDNCPDISPYTQYTYTYTAISNRTRIAFSFREDTGCFALDAVSVRSTTAPTIELIANNDFETGTLSSWTYCNPQSASSAGEVKKNSDSFQCMGYTYQAKSGTSFYYDGAVGNCDYLIQMFSTNIGSTYTISYWLYNQGSGSASSADVIISI